MINETSLKCCLYSVVYILYSLVICFVSLEFIYGSKFIFTVNCTNPILINPGTYLLTRAILAMIGLVSTVAHYQLKLEGYDMKFHPFVNLCTDVISWIFTTVWTSIGLYLASNTNKNCPIDDIQTFFILDSVFYTFFYILMSISHIKSLYKFWNNVTSTINSSHSDEQNPIAYHI